MASLGLEQYFTEDELDDFGMEAAEDAVLMHMDKGQRLLDQIDAIDDKIDTLDYQDAETIVSQEQIYDDLTGLGIDLSALRDYGFEDFGMESSVGGLSGFLGRLRQVYADDFLQSVTYIVNEMKTLNGRFSGTRKKLDKVAEKYRSKKDSTDKKEVKGSYAGAFLSNAFTVGGRMTDKPIDQIKREVDVASYIFTKYQPAVGTELENLEDVLANGDTSSEEAFDKTIADPAKKFKNPVDLFDNKYLEARFLMYNCGFVVVGRKNTGNGLVGFTKPQKLKFSYGQVGEAQLIRDIILSVDEIGTAIDGAYKQLEQVETFLNRNVSQMRQRAKNIAKSSKAATKNGTSKDVSTAHKTELKGLKGYGKSLKRCYFKVPMQVAKHAVRSARASSYFAHTYVRRM